jgi:hypothetical protein
MSLAAAWVEERRALLGTDAEAVTFSDPPHRIVVSKLFVLPALPCAVTVRGSYSVMCMVPGLFNTVTDAADAAKVAPTIGEVIEKFWRTQSDDSTVLDLLLGCEIVFVGWSSRESRFVGCRYSNAGAGFTADRFDGVLAAPWEADWPAPWRSNTIEMTVEMLEYQRNKLRALVPEAAAGTLFTVAEITRDKVVVHRIGREARQ